MALTLTSRYTGFEDTSGTDTLTSSSFTPNNNSLLVVAYAQQENVNTDPGTTTTISGGGLTYTLQQYNYLFGGNHNMVSMIWTAPVSTGSSMTVAVATGLADWGAAMAIMDFTGYDTGTPVGVKGGRSDAGGTPFSPYSVTLSGTCASDSYLIGVGVGDESQGSDLLVGTGWTQHYKQLALYTGTLIQYRTGTASSTGQWDYLFTGYSAAASIIEIKAAAGGGGGATSNKIYRRNTKIIKQRF